jgi:hypothetical protein
VVLRALAIGALVAAIAAAPAHAVLPTGNLTINGGGETGTAATDSSGVFAPPGWATTGEFTEVAYGASGGFPDAAASASFGGGKNFFAGGNVDVSTAVQPFNINAAAPEIDRGGLVMTLSARLGGFEGQDDNAQVTTELKNSAGATLARIHLAPVMSADRNSVTTLLPRSASVGVPVGTRTLLTTITSTRVSGSYNDGYADNVTVHFGGGGPEAGQTGEASTVSGKVLVRRPRSAKFVALGPSGEIPVGTIVDARNGTVRIKVAFEGGKTKTGQFNGGIFRFTEPREKAGGKRRLTARLALVGGNFAACRTRADAGAARRRVVRYLKAKASGRFRVVGKNSSGIERGTSWTTSDGCDGTLTTVTQGAVLVTDFAKRKTVVVRAGHSYLARA